MQPMDAAMNWRFKKKNMEAVADPGEVIKNCEDAKPDYEAMNTSAMQPIDTDIHWEFKKKCMVEERRCNRLAQALKEFGEDQKKKKKLVADLAKLVAGPGEVMKNCEDAKIGFADQVPLWLKENSKRKKEKPGKKPEEEKEKPEEKPGDEKEKPEEKFKITVPTLQAWLKVRHSLGDHAFQTCTWSQPAGYQDAVIMHRMRKDREIERTS
jgi:hypothetical protein